MMAIKNNQNTFTNNLHSTVSYQQIPLHISKIQQQYLHQTIITSSSSFFTSQKPLTTTQYQLCNQQVVQIYHLEYKFNSMEKQQATNAQAFCILNNALKQFKQASFDTAHHSYSQALQTIENSPSLQHLKQSIYSLIGVSLEQQHKLEQALVNINSSLKLNKTHQLSLLRRAKIYLKLGKIQEGLNDLQSFIELAPDVEIDCLLSRFEDAIDNLEQTEDKYNLKKKITQLRFCEDDEQELFLSFCNLKVIDRKSTTIPKKTTKKQSVYFGEQLVYPIQLDENAEKDKSETTNFTKQMKINKIQEQLKDQNFNQEDQKKIYKLISTPQKEKRGTILKTTQSSLIKIPSLINVNSNISEPNNSVIDVLKVNNIDGKIIKKTKSEIKFRKSQFPTVNSETKHRKSILKTRKSDITNNLQRRTSKLEEVTNIDGKVLSYGWGSHQNIDKSNKSIDSQQEFNIYGADKMSEDEVNSIVHNWFGQSVSNKGSTTSSRKSALKHRNTEDDEEQKQKKRRTVLFKQ